MERNKINLGEGLKEALLIVVCDADTVILHTKLNVHAGAAAAIGVRERVLLLRVPVPDQPRFERDRAVVAAELDRVTHEVL